MTITDTTLAKMPLSPNPEKDNAHKSPPLPLEILSMIMDKLDRSELIRYMKAFEDDTTMRSRITTTKILDEARQKTRIWPPSRQAWEDYTAKVQENVSMRAKDKVLQDPVYMSIIEALVAKLNKPYLGVNGMLEILSCPRVIWRLRMISLISFGGDAVPLFEEIRRHNPSIKWDLGHEYGDCLPGLQKLSNLEVLEGLDGIMIVRLRTMEQLHFLEAACAKCHPSLRLKLDIFNSGVPIQRLANFTSIVRRLAKLSIDYLEPQPGSGYSFIEDESHALDTLCKDYEFDLVLFGSGSESLSECTHIPERLVGVTMRYPTREAVSRLSAYTKRGVLRELCVYIDSLQTARTFTSDRFPLTYLEVECSLKDKTEISLFRQICKAHSRLLFDISLRDWGLLRSFLQDFPNNMAICLLMRTARITRESCTGEGIEIECDSRILEYLPDLDLSSLRSLKLSLSRDYELDEMLITTLLKSSLNLREFLIRHDYRDGPLDDFSNLLRRLVTENCKHLNKLTTPYDDRFSRITLSGFHREERLDTLAWHRAAI